MRENHIFFDGVEPEIAFGVFESPTGVAKTVQPMSLVAVVPIVQKVVVEERTADERTRIDAKAQFIRDFKAGHGDEKRVLEHADFAVLHKPLLELEPVGAQYIACALVDYSHCLHRRH